MTDRRIVVGVDGSPESMQALIWAAHEARLREVVLEVVHVDFYRHEATEVFDPDLLEDEKSVLGQALARVRVLEPSVVVRGRLCEPPPADALVEASVGAEMLVVGSRGLSGMKRVALGSVSNECVYRGRCPVVVIPPFGAQTATAATGVPDVADPDPA